MFNLYSDVILKTLEDFPGLNLHGHNLTDIRYADDILDCVQCAILFKIATFPSETSIFENTKSVVQKKDVSERFCYFSRVFAESSHKSNAKNNTE